MAERAAKEIIPVTVIGGYLGAGKTTLVNHLLRTADGLRLAVLVNEFGSLAIDEDLILARDDNLISLAGGCVCCSFGSDLMTTLMDLQQMRPSPQRIIIEASGVALPAAIAASVSLLPDYRPEGVVVLADAESVMERAADVYMGDTITRQLADADLVLLSKCDLIDTARKAQLLSWLSAQIASTAVIPTSAASLPPPAALFGLDHSAAWPPAGPVNFSHDQLYASLVVRVPTTLWAADVAALLQSRPLGVLRAKGLCLASDGGLQAVQMVGNRVQQDRYHGPAPQAINQLVFIGLKEHLLADEITALFTP